MYNSMVYMAGYRELQIRREAEAQRQVDQIGIPEYKYVIHCGCGLYTASDLDDYDQHLAEIVEQDGPNIKLHIERTYVQMVRTDLK